MQNIMIPPLDKHIPHLLYALDVLFLSSPTRSVATSQETTNDTNFLTTILQIQRKVADNPANTSFRKIRSRNTMFRDNILTHKHGEDIMTICGWKEVVVDFQPNWICNTAESEIIHSVQIIEQCLETFEKQTKAFADDVQARLQKVKKEREEKLRILEIAREDRERVAYRSRRPRAVTPVVEPLALIKDENTPENMQARQEKERMRLLRMAKFTT